MTNAKTLSVSIASEIENIIIEGSLKPGDRIPNEQELMETYHTSRSTIREAIKSLVSRGTLEIRRGKGTFVCQLPGMTDDPLGLNFLGIDNLNPYLYEARLIFEPEICGLSAKRATVQEIRILQKLSDSIDELDKDLHGQETEIQVIQQLHEKDKAFHIMLCRTCHNPVLERMMPIIIQSISVSYDPITFKNRLTSKPRRSTHDKICKAISAHNAELTKELMYQHLYNAMDFNY
uniref:FadR/GntR family transcriptional regulator n=1 Tax=Enterocloster clostridioformis TaxID=1531 RepID=UPI0026F12E47|nr:FadR/GntR family transcriptional regulator [Enterocloster clostridioformis]